MHETVGAASLLLWPLTDQIGWGVNGDQHSLTAPMTVCPMTFYAQERGIRLDLLHLLKMCFKKVWICIVKVLVNTVLADNKKESNY